jgi:predicted nucleic acid-binding protein
VNLAPRFVLDASVAIVWALRDENHPIADLAFSMMQIGSAVVPVIWWYEVRNVLIQCEQRGRILPDDSDLFLLNLGRLRIEVESLLPTPRVMDLARKHNLSTYDAAYLALAVRESLGIATLDRALESACRIEAVPLLR